MKDCLLWGCTNAITYKDVFPLLKEKILRPGYIRNQTQSFELPDGTSKEINIYTYTTLKTTGRPLILTKRYTPEEYPKYDNYDAINVDKIKDIPCDYKGLMGVPITIFNYDLDNVEINLITNNSTGSPTAYINGNRIYQRVLISLTEK